jgi:hypothetical protein
MCAAEYHVGHYGECLLSSQGGTTSPATNASKGGQLDIHGLHIVIALAERSAKDLTVPHTSRNSRHLMVLPFFNWEADDLSRSC